MFQKVMESHGILAGQECMNPAVAAIFVSSPKVAIINRFDCMFKNREMANVHKRQ